MDVALSDPQQGFLNTVGFDDLSMINSRPVDVLVVLDCRLEIVNRYGDVVDFRQQSNWANICVKRHWATLRQPKGSLLVQVRLRRSPGREKQHRQPQPQDVGPHDCAGPLLGRPGDWVTVGRQRLEVNTSSTARLRCWVSKAASKPWLTHGGRRPRMTNDAPALIRSNALELGTPSVSAVRGNGFTTMSDTASTPSSEGVVEKRALLAVWSAIGRTTSTSAGSVLAPNI